MGQDSRIEVIWSPQERRVTLGGDRGNSLDPDRLGQLERLFAARPAVPTILAARGRSFCTGLDLDYALACDRDRMRDLILGFHRALRAVFAYPAPVVAAIGGHALAGGALLTATCDRRVMAEGDARWGIHGAHLGIAYPHVAVQVVRYQYGRAAAERILYAGALDTAAVAVAEGKVDRLAPPDQLESAARAELGDLSQSSWTAFAANKRGLRAAALARLDHLIASGEEAWLDRWFDPDTRRRIAAARRDG